MNTQTSTIKFEFIETGEKLSDNFSLGYEALIFIPTTYDGNKPLPTKIINEIAAKIRHLCAVKFGGANSEGVRVGSWVSDKLGMIDEKNIVVHVLFGTWDEETDQWFGSLGESIKIALSQESVLIVINDSVKAYFA